LVSLNEVLDFVAESTEVAYGSYLPRNFCTVLFWGGSGRSLGTSRGAGLNHCAISVTVGFTRTAVTCLAPILGFGQLCFPFEAFVHVYVRIKKPNRENAMTSVWHMDSLLGEVHLIYFRHPL